MFITFEGPEGSGKSTQARLLAEGLERRGIKVRLTREPGGDPVSERIRDILLGGADGSVNDHAELLLYLAARAQHTATIIRPCLEAGFVVISARYTDSTLAYQGYGNGLDIELVRRANDFATGGLVPDLTFLLDIEVEVGLRRQDQWNRMERKALDFHRRVREGFLAEARRDPGRVVVVDASQDVEEIGLHVLRIVADRLGLVV